MIDLAELFDKDPTALTAEERKEMITAYRQQRAQFNLGGKVGPAKAKAEKKKAPTNIDVTELRFD